MSLTADEALFSLDALLPPPPPLVLPDNLLPLQAHATSAAAILALYDQWHAERDNQPRPWETSYAWHPTFTGPRFNLDDDRHDPAILTVDLRCDWHLLGHRDCPCVGAMLYRHACTGCDLIDPPRDSENAAVEDAMDHQWAGWRDLPILRCSMPEGGKPLTRWRDAALAAYPDGWLETGGPLRTARGRMGRRHVPGRTPWGGYDLGTVVAEHWHSTKPGVFDPGTDLAVAESLGAA